MERPVLLLTVEDLILVLALLTVIGLGLALTLRYRRGPPGADTPRAAGIAPLDDPLAPAYDQLRALEAIEVRTLRAVAEHRGRIKAMRQQIVDGTPEEQELLDAVQRLTFAAITAQHDRALAEALTTQGVDE